MGSFILGRKIARLTPKQKTVGVLLPNAIGALLTLFGLQAFGRVPAMLNFSTGAINMSAACTAAQVTTIVTSRKFIEAAEMEGDIAILSKNCQIIYLEDVRESIGKRDKLYGLFARSFPALRSALGQAPASDPNSPAVILFTSGSEGVPKGVVLSHRNLNANRLQAAARIGFSAQDIVFNAMPMFHAFGLLGGTLLPVLSGVYSFFYPSPLHYKIVPELCYDTNATVLFGTDTFLMGYARNAHPYDFFSMRLIVAGAERVKPETREIWMEKFGHRILEGYGATECSPVIAINTPMHNRSGSVGRLLDRIEYRLEPVEGIAAGGRLFVKGPNVMLGYLRADNPGVIEAPPDGWYDTGDIVEVDEHRFVTILGRAKRFSKIAGEMVSLTAVETKLQEAFPGENFAVVAIPDEKKGEQLILFTTIAQPERAAIAEGLKSRGASDLMIPKVLVHLEEIPLLGSGKTDYVTLDPHLHMRGPMADGKAHQLAMQLVEQAARIMGAPRLIPISFAHIDACFYTGQSHVDFVRFLLEHGAKLSVPTWTNNSVASPDDGGLRPERSDPEMVRGAHELMELYAKLGCKPTWTCAPYQLAGRAEIRRPHRRGRIQCGGLLQFRCRRPHQQIWRLSRRGLRHHRPGALCRAPHR